jgi:hypothetical protein
VVLSHRREYAILATLTTKAEKEEGASGKTPERLCAHKSHIIKVIFLAAVARPIFDNDGRCVFDGKIC